MIEKASGLIDKHLEKLIYLYQLTINAGVKPGGEGPSNIGELINHFTSGNAFTELKVMLSDPAYWMGWKLTSPQSKWSTPFLAGLAVKIAKYFGLTDVAGDLIGKKYQPWLEKGGDALFWSSLIGALIYYGSPPSGGQVPEFGGLYGGKDAVAYPRHVESKAYVRTHSPSIGIFTQQNIIPPLNLQALQSRVHGITKWGV